MEYTITTFYKFTPLKKQRLKSIKQELEEKAVQLNVFGLILIAEEGINATVAGSASEIEQYKEFLNGEFGEIRYKDSPSDAIPFKRFKVKIKPEIVQLQRTDIRPTGNEAHLSPEQWDELVEQEDAVIIDVRNWYETKLGAFKNAIDPKTWKFSQFPEWLKKADITKSKKIGIYCTGGIRCEKAAIAMKEQGYENVYQLDGGILNYIEKRPGKNFTGDCFVFDHRIAVGQDLRPSRQYTRCWSCGNGATINQACEMCEAEYQTCEDCIAVLPARLCSKNCRYQHELKNKKTVISES